MSFSLHI